MRAGTEQKCFDSGMNDIVAKPMKLQMLQRILKKEDKFQQQKCRASFMELMDIVSPVASMCKRRPGLEVPAWCATDGGGIRNLTQLILGWYVCLFQGTIPI